MGLTFGRTVNNGSVPIAAPVEGTRGPRVALALGAGAARGWALIGVVRELLAQGITPDIVVGTSMGAVVGGCYGAGRLDELERFALSLTRRRVFGLMDFTVSGMGLISGSRLRTMLTAALGDTQIETMPVRFATVATQVHTGHEVWLSRGNLVEALRASYALPGVFEPVFVDGRWLMDGALVNPVPVSVCRALGADTVIAVNLVAETLARPDASAAKANTVAAQEVETVGGLFRGRRGRIATNPRPQHLAGPSMAKVLVDAFNITQDRIARSRLAGDPPDLTINAKVGRIGLFEFHRAAELIALGREAAQRAQPDLADLFRHPLPLV